MKKTVFALAAALLGHAALADIAVGDAYAYPTVENMSTGGVFVSLTNRDAADDKLVGASVSERIAGKVELHTHINDNGVMRMREVQGGVELPAGKTQELKRGSYHIMLFGLKKPLKVGDTFRMTLNYQRNKPQTVTVTVQPMNHGSSQSGGHQHDTDGDMHGHHHHH